MTKIKPFSKVEVDVIWRDIERHLDEHLMADPFTLCPKECRRRVLMESINSIIEVRNEREERISNSQISR